jgi:hypothetical protein
MLEYSDILLSVHDRFRDAVSVLLDNIQFDSHDPAIIKSLYEINAELFQKLVAHHLVGVQVMKKPTDSLELLQYAKGENTVPNRVEFTKNEATAQRHSLNTRLPYMAQKEAIPSILYKIGFELDHSLTRMIHNMVEEPTAKNTFDQSQISGQSTFVTDEFAALAVLIGRQANLIATRTRRGKGNWAVVSPMVLTILEAARASAFARTTEPLGSCDPGFIQHVGYINSSIKVFCDPYADADTPILVGYKGDSETDGGLVWAPHQLVNTSGEITADLNYPLYTEYGLLPRVDDTTYYGNSADWFGKVGINSKTVSFI